MMGNSWMERVAECGAADEEVAVFNMFRVCAFHYAFTLYIAFARAAFSALFLPCFQLLYLLFAISQ
ncbi:hypothetical protein FA13DRAFT_1741380 [Coprinellus micaceus]|uniref:Uncharacterized protein n=1 Tax=Coprinellus micaceus TaxID=71717 RepID=A0A4Y7SJD0_COPMI|nr:hypothetical protein FA13DRAFT_1741380 [Coprinellus micaceus]